MLTPHPDTPCAAVRAIEVEVARSAAGSLDLRYLLRGAIGDLALPPRTDPARTDGLWRHTCFEAFVRGPAEAYVEINLAPSTQWAAYRFDGYRQGMAPLDVPAPCIDVASASEAFELAAALALGDDLPAQAPWRLGLSAVIEAADGTISYWAVRHPPGRPDFHHADCFALELPAPETP